MRAWVDLEEIRLTLKGHGKPKPVEAKNARPKSKGRASGPILSLACGASGQTAPQPPLPANVTPPESG
jgi:hypothetical protein